MTSSNVKTVAKPSHRIVAVLKSLHFALGEFNCKGSLNIAGIREKLDFACALDPMVSKTDILDLFWHFSIKHVVFAESTFFPSWFYRLARQLKHSDITLIDRCQNRSRISVFLPWRPGHTKFNISRTPPMFKESLKLNSHGKVSVSQRKKREFDNRNLMHVITLLNTINIFRPTNAGKPGGNRCRIQSRCYFNWRFHERQLINAISVGEKKRRNWPNWLCFTAKRSEDYSIQRLRHVMVSRQSSHSMTSCPR